MKLNSNEINLPADDVIVSTKLGRKWYGPFKVLRKVGHVCYEVELPRASKGHPIFHASKLAKYYLASDPERHPPPPEPVQVDGEVEYNVEAILKHRKHRGVWQWLVKWRGHPGHETSWEPFENLEGNEFHTEYLRKHPVQL